MSGQIFISYRREESRWSARSLNDRLCRDFERKQIFMDLDAIALGEDFVEAIETTVAKCDVLIAVIGNNWLTSKDERGSRRLDNPEDFVRMEIGTALRRKIRVIPVLVDGAVMPSPTELPEDLKLLVRRNALRIADTSFDGDCQRLVAAIKLVLEKATAEEQERLAAEQRQREETEARERAEEERLEAEQREKERLEAEERQRDEQKREAAEKREREEQKRLSAQNREREEQERLVAAQRQRDELEVEQRRREQEAPRGQSVQRGRTPETQGPLERKRQRLRLIDKYSWVPLALSVVAFLFLPIVGTRSAIQEFFPYDFLLCIAPSSVLAISSFLNYRFRRVFEGYFSIILAGWNLLAFVYLTILVNQHVSYPPGIGLFLGLGLALVGTVAKIYLFVRRDDLDAT